MCGNEIGRLATLANPRHWIRETGNGCQSTALDLGNWQGLPEVGIGCQRLASVAALPNSLPEIGDRRRELKSSASS
jgi:hypothetical protein